MQTLFHVNLMNEQACMANLKTVYRFFKTNIDSNLKWERFYIPYNHLLFVLTSPYINYCILNLSF